MGKLKNKMYRFMYGRYGYDTLGKVLLWTYAALLLVYMVLQFIIEEPLFYVLYPIAIFALVCYTFYRAMSRNIAKRRAENEKFCGFFKLRRNKFRDRKTHVYRKCPDCRAVLRLPKSKGKHTVVCPRCKKRFEVKG
ncbi:MAG: hypothetical protein IJV72_04065 [Clostridia bacterium]|nr:hypothetical protein [Clostridia bacterium]